MSSSASVSGLPFRGEEEVCTLPTAPSPVTTHWMRISSQPRDAYVGKIVAQRGKSNLERLCSWSRHV